MNFKSKVVAGVGWTAGANFAGQIVTWAITIVVMRLLSPGDYGLLAMASVFVAFLAMMAAAGLGPAIVQSAAIDDAALRQLFGLIMALNAILCLLLFAAAPLIANFFHEPRLTAIIQVLSFQFVISGFAVIPEALLGRALRFKARALVDLLSNVTGGVVTLILAWRGHGVWSLVVGAMVIVCGKSIGLNLAYPYLRRPSFSLKGARPMLAYGGNVTASRMLWFFYSQADMFIAGKLLGKEALGYYSVAMHLASLPVQKISGVLNQVAFPAFAQIQRDPELVSRHMLKAVRILCFFAFPVLWGISSVAPEVVHLLLGPKWDAAILPLQVLPAIMPFRMISNLLPSAVDAVGRPDISVKNLITASVVMPAAFLIGGQWGIKGLCAAWVIGFPLVFLANLRRALPVIHIRMGSFLQPMVQPALSGLAMYAAVFATGRVIPWAIDGFSRLAILVGVGALAYAAMALSTNRSGVQEVLRAVRM